MTWRLHRGSPGGLASRCDDRSRSTTANRNGVADAAAKGTGSPEDALRPAQWRRTDVGGNWSELRSDPRAHSPDRGGCPAQAEGAVSEPETEALPQRDDLAAIVAARRGSPSWTARIGTTLGLPHADSLLGSRLLRAEPLAPFQLKGPLLPGERHGGRASGPIRVHHRARFQHLPRQDVLLGARQVRDAVSA